MIQISAILPLWLLDLVEGGNHELAPIYKVMELISGNIGHVLEVT